MKSIKSLLNRLEVEEQTIEKIAKFLKTKRGQQFVIKLYTMPYKALCESLKVPKFMRLYNNDLKNRNLVISTIKKYNIVVPKPKYVKGTYKKGPKSPIRLKREELAKMTARYQRKELGFAALMYAYENHKVAMFEKKHLAPIEQLTRDLFSEELMVQRRTTLYLYREYTRNFLCKTYANVVKREPYFRLFLVFNNKFNNSLYEMEPDPYVVGYPFAGCSENTPLERLKQILRERKKDITADCLELKLYNKYGTLIASVKK